MSTIRRYQRDSFGPLLDRIDIHIKVPLSSLSATGFTVFTVQDATAVLDV